MSSEKETCYKLVTYNDKQHPNLFQAFLTPSKTFRIDVGLMLLLHSLATHCNHESEET